MPSKQEVKPSRRRLTLSEALKKQNSEGSNSHISVECRARLLKVNDINSYEVLAKDSDLHRRGRFNAHQPTGRGIAHCDAGQGAQETWQFGRRRRIHALLERHVHRRRRALPAGSVLLLLFTTMVRLPMPRTVFRLNSDLLNDRRPQPRLISHLVNTPNALIRLCSVASCGDIHRHPWTYA